MTRHDAGNVRNIGLFGHSGGGKTTLTEALLAATGAINSAGSVERGSTVSDFDPQEKNLQHSLNASVCHFEHEGLFVNLIDTPGFPDFQGRAISVMPAVETACVVINAQTGIELVTERVMESAARRKLSRMIVVNRIDTADTHLPQLMEDLRQRFGSVCLPINLPSPGHESVVDCFFRPDFAAQTEFSSVQEAHDQLIDQVVEVDEALMELYLEQGQSLQPDQLHGPFEKSLREGHLIPVCFVSAASGAGIAQLIEVIERLMPNPMEGNLPPFLKGEGKAAQPVTVVADANRHVVAHVFKIAIDPYVGKLGIFRVHQGTITPNTQLFIGDGRKPFKVAHLYHLQGKQQIEIPEAVPGDICAVSKVDEIHFDAVLHDSHEEDHFHLVSMDCPPPMHGLAIKPTRHGDEQKLSEVLHKIDAEDPCVVIDHRVALNETVIRGMGELHLQTILERMREQYRLEFETQPPSVAYKETITAKAEGHYRHKKQSGGAGQFAEVVLQVEPLQRGEGFEFVSKVVGGAIPGQFIPAIEKGVRQIMESGSIAGYPMQDIRVTVQDGKFHSVDSKEVAFVIAGKKAFLEPIANVRITSPDRYMGDITGDISNMRGIINGSTTLANNRVEVSAQVPVGKMDSYLSRLKSITGGEGLYTLEFSHYEPVPSKTQEELMRAFHPGEESD